MTALSKQHTSQYQWHRLVEEAHAECAVKPLDDELKAYLINLLQRFVSNVRLAQSILAIEYLESSQIHGVEQKIKLRDIGDKCLLFSGLFPERAYRRNVSVVYFVQMGHAAYDTLSQKYRTGSDTGELFQALNRHFIQLMDLLHYIRAMRDDQALDPFQAAELWNKTGSQYARRVLDEASEPT